ncbi:hypothetical protein R4575_18170 [Acinetobacter baumannii]|nr:hypothetical protein [Acinetobacter baumannii]
MNNEQFYEQVTNLAEVIISNKIKKELLNQAFGAFSFWLSITKGIRKEEDLAKLARMIAYRISNINAQSNDVVKNLINHFKTEHISIDQALVDYYLSLFSSSSDRKGILELTEKMDEKLNSAGEESNETIRTFLNTFENQNKEGRFKQIFDNHLNNMEVPELVAQMAVHRAKNSPLVMDEFWWGVDCEELKHIDLGPTARISLEAVQTVENGLVLTPESQEKLDQLHNTLESIFDEKQDQE